MADKYVVFKVEDVKAALGDESMDRNLLAKAIDDAWVIRKQDAHAAPSAYAYANAVQTTIEILEGTALSEDDRHKAIEGLEGIRDAAFEFAESARATQSRLPD